MDASSPLCAKVLCWALLGLSWGCNIELEPQRGLTSLRLALRSPPEGQLGSAKAPIAPTDVLFDVQALDEQGHPASGNYQLNAFVTSAGSRLSLKSPCGKDTCAPPQPVPGDWVLGTVVLSQGRAQGVRLPLSGPAIFGTVSLNLEEPASTAIGATPPIYFANPTISALMKPQDPDAKDATCCTPFLNRHVVIEASPGGKLVVSSLFPNSLAVTDTGSPEYGSIYVFTFSQPPAKLVPGRVVARIAGAISKFNSFTQVANPDVTPTDEVRTDLVPTPVVLTAAMRPSAGNKDLAKLIAAPVRVTGMVCDLNDSYRADSWKKYSTFVLSLDEATDACDNRKTFSVQLQGQGFAGFDIMKHARMQVTITGMLQNGATTSGTLFWTLVVRTAADVCLPGAMC